MLQPGNCNAANLDKAAHKPGSAWYRVMKHDLRDASLQQVSHSVRGNSRPTACAAAHAIKVVSQHASSRD